MNDHLIHETAQAWGLEDHTVASMVTWIDHNIPVYRKSRIFTVLLQRAYTKVPRMRKQNPKDSTIRRTVPLYTTIRKKISYPQE